MFALALVPAIPADTDHRNVVMKYVAALHEWMSGRTSGVENRSICSYFGNARHSKWHVFLPDVHHCQSK